MSRLLFARIAFAVRFLAACALTAPLCAPDVALASQANQVTPGSPLPMTSLASFLNAAFQALATCNSGTSAPTVGPASAPIAQMCWWNTVTTPWVLNYYDGAQWVPTFTLNPSTHTFSVPPGSLPVLSPGQVLGNNGTTSAPAFGFTPWLNAPGVGGLNLYASASGSDSGNQCTASGTPCTLKGACNVRSQFSMFLAGSVLIHLADGTYNSPDGNGALCTQNGNGGNGPILTSLQGNCTTPANVVLAVPNSDIGVLVQDLAEVVMTCITFTGGTNSIGISAGQHTVADVDRVHFGAFGTGSLHVQLVQVASYNITGGGEFIDGGAFDHWSMTGNAVMQGSAGTTITTNVTFAGAFLDTRGSVYVNLSGWTLTNSSTVTGSRGNLIGLGTMLTPSNQSVNATLPGTVNATIDQGFITRGSDLQTTGNLLNSAMPAHTNNGDIVYYSTGNSSWWQTLAGNTSGTKVLSENSSGTPSWVSNATTVFGTSCALGSSCTPTLPNPSASTLGGIESFAAVSHQWINAISTSGVPSATQPACGDLSNAGGACQLGVGTGLASAGGNVNVSLSSLTNSLSGNVNLSNSSYADGPSVAQGTSGTWMAVGQVTIQSPNQDVVSCKLWDGTTEIAGIDGQVVSASGYVPMPLSGKITNPAGNIKISCINDTATRGSIRAADGPGNESTLTVFRIN